MSRQIRLLHGELDGLLEMPLQGNVELHLLERLATYGITQNGFLPAHEPLARLPSDYYEPWESIMSRLPSLIETNMNPKIR